jgi:hypothetical protein
MGQPPAEFDYSTDQSTRVSRRVAHGVYRLTHGGRDVGEEVWGIFALRNGGYRLMTEIDLQWPVPNQQRANLDVDTRWHPQALWAQMDINNTRRMASYVPSGTTLDVQIVEARLHGDEDHSSKTKLRNQIAAMNPGGDAIRPATPGKTVSSRQLPFTGNTHLDFASALFNFVVLQRYQWSANGRVSFDSVVPTLPSLEPLQVPQSYCYEGDEALSAESSTPARRYTISESGTPDAVTTFWTDEHSIVLKQQLTLDGALHACEMVNYRWQG